MSDEHLFISDCHLDSSQPEVISKLTGFLKQRATQARRLYILGDLFEVWLGDDDPATPFMSVIDALKTLSNTTELFFLAGNRDFLLGKAFAACCGMKLLSEPHFIELGNETVALIHGDTLCTDDHDYQAFRTMVRGATWQSEFLAKSLPERQQIATGLRSESATAMTSKSMQIMDVNPQAVQAFFTETKINTIVHGHTHRPAIHHYPVGKQRIVLGDWRPEPSYLCWTPHRGFELTDSRV